jgi:hypothetical protein
MYYSKFDFLSRKLHQLIRLPTIPLSTCLFRAAIAKGLYNCDISTFCVQLMHFSEKHLNGENCRSIYLSDGITIPASELLAYF